MGGRRRCRRLSKTGGRRATETQRGEEGQPISRHKPPYSTLASPGKVCQRGVVFRVAPVVAALLALCFWTGEVAAQTATVDGENSGDVATPAPVTQPAAVAPAPASGVPERTITFRPEEYPAPEARVRTILLGVGLAAVGYGVAVGTSYLWDGAPGMQSLRTPVIGPVMAIGESKCGADEGPSCSTVTVVLRAILAGISGIAQIGGIGVLTEGVVMTTKEAPPARTGVSGWYALPTASKSSAGIQVGASF